MCQPVPSEENEYKVKEHRNEMLRLSVMAALAVPGASATSVGKKHGISRRTVERIKAEYRAEAALPRQLPDDDEADPVDDEVTATPGVSRLADWLAGAEDVLAAGVKFLRRALRNGNLDPGNPTHVRVVGESVVRVMADVVRVSWQLQAREGVRDGASIDAEVAALSDAELVAAAKDVIEKLH